MIGVLIVSSRDKLNRLVTTKEIFHDLYIYIYHHETVYSATQYRWCDATDEISREFVY